MEGSCNWEFQKHRNASLLVRNPTLRGVHIQPADNLHRHALHHDVDDAGRERRFLVFGGHHWNDPRDPKWMPLWPVDPVGYPWWSTKSCSDSSLKDQAKDLKGRKFWRSKTQLDSSSNQEKLLTLWISLGMASNGESISLMHFMFEMFLATLRLWLVGAKSWGRKPFGDSNFLNQRYQEAWARVLLYPDYQNIRNSNPGQTIKVSKALGNAKWTQCLLYDVCSHFWWVNLPHHGHLPLQHLLLLHRCLKLPSIFQNPFFPIFVKITYFLDCFPHFSIAQKVQKGLL